MLHKYGFFKIRSFVPETRIGDLEYNSQAIIDAVNEADKENIDCMVFPELSLTSYTCADLFLQEILMEKTVKAVKEIAEKTTQSELFFAIGAPVLAFGKRFNCAIAIYGGKILGIVPKSYLPNYSEFYEKRWFESGKDIKGQTIIFGGDAIPFGTDLIFQHLGVKIGIEICEDLWVPQPPSCEISMAGGEVILNLSASDDLIGKDDYIRALISQQSARCRCVYAYSSAGWGESSTDLVFTGKAIIGYDGKIYGGEKRFLKKPFFETIIADIEKLRLDRAKFNTFNEKASYSDSYRCILTTDKKPGHNLSDKNELDVNPYPFVPQDKYKLDQRCSEIIHLQSYGLMKRLSAIGCRKAIIGISGGLDSTLALLVTVKAFEDLNFDKKGIIAVTMPGLATTSRTHDNALQLMKSLGVTSREISIGKAVEQHFIDIGQDPEKYDATYENSQARERTQILMDLANKENGIVIGTGDMSELALGWCTYNGDQMSMYGVNVSIPKTLVRHLVEWYASKSDPETRKILDDICDTPISPELIPSGSDSISQKTEDLVGPYELHDFFLYHFLRNSFSPDKIYFLSCIAFEGKFDKLTILKWLKVFIKRFFSQQFKRSCMPDGPKVGSVSLSPRGDWRMPSDACVNLWLSQLDNVY